MNREKTMGFSKVIYWWIKKKMDNLLFQDNSRIYYINLSREAYEQMLHYCNESNPYETGGILIGNYSLAEVSTSVYEISNITAEKPLKIRCFQLFIIFDNVVPLYYLYF